MNSNNYFEIATVDDGNDDVHQDCSRGLLPVLMGTRGTTRAEQRDAVDACKFAVFWGLYLKGLMHVRWRDGDG
jgi:hypothetical protein